MRRTILVALATATIIASAAAIGIGTAVSLAPATMSHAEYAASLRGIDAAREDMTARCDALAAYEREFCRTEGAANEMVRVADIEESFRRNHQASRAAQRARIEARYQVDRFRCSGLGGQRRDKCLVSVHASKGRAMLEAAAPYELRF